jgi:N-acetylglucosamine malate deacetylase 1
MQKVLVVAAHPDDEVLGCGGTIAKLTAQGTQVYVGFIADGVSSRSENLILDDKEHLVRRDAAKKACQHLGVELVEFYDMPDNQLDTVSQLEVTQLIEGMIDTYKPDTIFTHHIGDVNIDHQCVHKAVMTACRPQQGSTVKLILSFEVPSSTEWLFPGSAPSFAPNWFIDISETIDKKLEALMAYEAELREWPHPRSLKGVNHLACWRGATIGVNFAEAFMLCRNIV